MVDITANLVCVHLLPMHSTQTSSGCDRSSFQGYKVSLSRKFCTFFVLPTSVNFITRGAFFEEFAQDAVITTALGQRLIDPKKFEDAIKKYEGVQTAAKKLVR